jgi:hypothetical protein
MQSELKPSWTLRAFLLISSLSIFSIGANAFIYLKGVEVLNAMCLVIPFFTAYVWLSKVKKVIVYWLMDLHFFWWIILGIVSAYSKIDSYFYISLPFIFIIFYSILKRKENYVVV